MQIKDSVVMTLIDQISEHYKRNVSNRFLRPALMRMQMEQRNWDLIESMTEKSDYYQLQGYHVDELYDRILAFGEFIYHARHDLAPNLRSYLTGSTNTRGLGSAANDRVLRDMSVNNFESNLAVLADLVNKLFVAVVQLDNDAAKGSSPVHKTIPRLKDLGRLLVPR